MWLMCCWNFAVLLAILLALFAVVLTLYLHLTKSDPDLSFHDDENYFISRSSKDGRVQFPTIDSPPEVDLSVIVPAYNEESRLSLMMDEALEYLTARQKSNPEFLYEIIVVDDGSTDSTSKVALEYSEKYGTNQVRVLTQVKNRGKGGAVRMGMLRGRGRMLMFADADGATKFSDIQKLEESLQKETSQKKLEDEMVVVCGSRAHLEKESIAQRSVIRTFLMYGFHFLVWFLCVHGIHDTQCGFKLFTRSAARLLFYNLHVHRWAFDVELLHIAQHFSIPITEVAVNWTEIPGSKLSPLQASIQMARDLFMIRLRYLTGSWKMNYKLKKQ